MLIDSVILSAISANTFLELYRVEQSSIFYIFIIYSGVGMMCIVNAQGKLINKLGNIAIIHSAGILGKMDYAPQRIISLSIAESVRIRAIKD